MAPVSDPLRALGRRSENRRSGTARRSLAGRIWYPVAGEAAFAIALWLRKPTQGAQHGQASASSRSAPYL